MDVLKELMDSPNFTIIVFSLVGVLIVIFLILLLTGKKKEKVAENRMDNTNLMDGSSNDGLGMQEDPSIIETPPVVESQVQSFENPTPNVFETPAPINTANPAVIGDPINDLEVPDFNPRENLGEEVLSSPVMESLTPEVNPEPMPSMAPSFEQNMNMNLNPSDTGTTFAPKQDEIASGIVPPQMELPKLNDEIQNTNQVVKDVPNEIGMPSAPAPVDVTPNNNDANPPRPFDVENRDL